MEGKPQMSSTVRRDATSMVKVLQKVLIDKRGATAVEYGFMLVMIVLAMMSALRGVAEETSALWSDVTSKTEEATSGS